MDTIEAILAVFPEPYSQFQFLPQLQDKSFELREKKSLLIIRKCNENLTLSAPIALSIMQRMNQKRYEHKQLLPPVL